jgi:hypothetical protein
LPRAGRLTAALAVAALVTTAIAGGPAAFADGDPASDVLLGESVFYPYTPPVPASVTKALNAEMTAAGRAHFPLKVALIASPVDLGVIPEMFGKPQKYADFLDQEISFQGKQPLLVVMRDGYGVQGLPPAATAAVPALPKPASGTSEGLAKAAIVAVARLARAAGHPIAQPSASTAAPSGGGSSVALFGAVAGVALLCAGTLVALRRRRPRSRPG